MLAFQGTDLYRSVLDLNVLARDLETDDYLDGGYFVDALQDRTMSMLVDLANAESSTQRREFLDEVRVSACVCAALFDICGKKDEKPRALLAKIVGLIDGEQATSSRGRR